MLIVAGVFVVVFVLLPIVYLGVRTLRGDLEISGSSESRQIFGRNKDEP